MAIRHNQQVQELIRRNHELEDARRRNQWASTIHDNLTAQLSLIVLLAKNEALHDHDRSTLNTLDSISSTAEDLLAIVHEIIDTLSCSDQNKHHAMMMLRDDILQVTSKAEARLHEVGLTGDTIIEGNFDDGIVSPDRHMAIIALLNELYNNILRHASREATYLLRIQFQPTSCTITQMNEISLKPKLLQQGGFGLKTQQQAITNIGGNIITDSDGRTWICRATIPLCTPPSATVEPSANQYR
ncbi:hypothetical protein JS533_009430 [Bifidobacterium amazonense]|uniref:Signal transduction histidine kinase subgroup 3 dimerisation and phosphoacceptor domain-containing protein n=1 Tax=Bifidobacterium amazonense TaxID=2809027 RepID=A0ABS9VWM3_9BIFI|nr:hypothetical protein [Bifidobacterium amazonense]MCH9276482.1 hypothetical protein [Bifidobacterium amazonense]